MDAGWSPLRAEWQALFRSASLTQFSPKIWKARAAENGQRKESQVSRQLFLQLDIKPEELQSVYLPLACTVPLQAVSSMWVIVPEGSLIIPRQEPTCLWNYVRMAESSDTCTSLALP